MIAGELPSREAYSGELTYAFHDLHPVAPVHVLVVPREHIPDASQVSPEHGAGAVEMFAGAQPSPSERASRTRVPARFQHRAGFRRRGAPPAHARAGRPQARLAAGVKPWRWPRPGASNRPVGRLGRYAGRAHVSVTVTVPNHLMAGLVGPLNENLRSVEEAFGGARIIARGNEFNIEGDDAAVVARLVEELKLLLEHGQVVDPQVVARTIDILRADERPSEVLTAEILRSARGRSVRPKSSGQKRYVDAIGANIVTFGIGPAGTGKSYLAVALAVQALQAKSVERIIMTRPAVEAGERLGFLPGDLMAKIDPYLRPLYDALYDMLGTDGARRLLDNGTIEVAPLAYMRGRTLEQELHNPGRGPKCHARAIEDVPHQDRFRLEGRRQRRHNPGRPARRPVRSGRAGPGPKGHRRYSFRPPGEPGRGPSPHRRRHRLGLRRLRIGQQRRRARPAGRREDAAR